MSDGAVVGGISATSIVMLGAIALGMWGCPQYNVYSQRLEGEAQLAKAEQSREVAVRQARAQKDAAVYLADAEIARAKGVAEANKIIGASLQGNESYLRYLWIQTLEHDKGKTIVYVPTEASLPVLEAGRHLKP